MSIKSTAGQGPVRKLPRNHNLRADSVNATVVESEVPLCMLCQRPTQQMLEVLIFKAPVCEQCTRQANAAAKIAQRIASGK